MKKIPSILFLLFFLQENSFAQDTLTYPKTKNSKIIDTTYAIYSKWPFMGPEVPPHLGIIFGYEGFRSGNLTFGLYHNIGNITTYGDFSRSAGYVGYTILYKKYFSDQILYSLESDIGIFSVIAMGININYNQFEENSVIGVKPFLGLSLFHFDIYYGYSFYKKSKDPNNLLSHNRITVRISIPLLKLTRKKEMVHYLYSNDDD